MALPDRPVDGAEIATDWGQEIHDRTFAPSGCQVHSSSAVSCGTTPTQLNLDVVDEDPGGFLVAASDRITIPTGREGLYQVFVQGNSVNGSAGSGFQTRCFLLKNGATLSTGIEDNAGGTNEVVPITWIGTLAAADQLTVFGQRRGGGTNPSVSVLSFILVRIGAEIGA